MRIAGVLLAIAVALSLQATLARFMLGRPISLDLGLLVVVAVALTWGPVAGLFTGTVAGLLQDALSGAILGIGGLSKTVVGFVVGVIGSQFIVTQTPTRFLVFFGATIAYAALFLGTYALVEPRPFAPSYLAIVAQATGNALVGVLGFKLVDGLPGAVERRRARRGSLSKRWAGE